MINFLFFVVHLSYITRFDFFHYILLNANQTVTKVTVWCPGALLLSLVIHSQLHVDYNSITVIETSVVVCNSISLKWPNTARIIGRLSVNRD